MSSVDLYRLSRTTWAIVVAGIRYDCPSMEDAADLLEACGVISDEIDAAIISLVTNNHIRANFGIVKGTFIFSDEQELIGDYGYGNT